MVLEIVAAVGGDDIGAGGDNVGFGESHEGGSYAGVAAYVAGMFEGEVFFPLAFIVKDSGAVAVGTDADDGGSGAGGMDAVTTFAGNELWVKGIGTHLAFEEEELYVGIVAYDFEGEGCLLAKAAGTFDIDLVGALVGVVAVGIGCHHDDILHVGYLEGVGDEGVGLLEDTL